MRGVGGGKYLHRARPFSHGQAAAWKEGQSPGLFELTQAVGCKVRAVDQSAASLVHCGGVVVRSRFLPFAAPHDGQRKRQGEGVSMHISCTPVRRGGEGDGPNIGRAGGIRQYHCIDLDGASANLKRTAMDRLAAGSTYRYMAPHLLDIVKTVGTGAKRDRWHMRML